MTHTAIIAAAPDLVDGEFCDVSVVGNTADGDPSDNVVMPPQDTTTTPAGGDPEPSVREQADAILTANGWRRVDDWADGGNALYCTVELA